LVLITPHTRFHSPVLLYHQTVAQLADKVNIINYKNLFVMNKENFHPVLECINETKVSSVKQAISKEMKKELAKARKEAAISRMMKAEIMVKTENGYTINETSRRFGLLKNIRYFIASLETDIKCR